MMTAAEILRDLVAIPTPSAVSNVSCIAYVQSFVEARGWRAKVFHHTDETGVAKANMIARPSSAQTNDDIDLAFVCHTDTVPYAADWANALRLSPDGPLLRGCGACDVKGSLACFLAALDSLGKQHVRKNVALILTADEEIGCKGMERLLAATRLHIRSAIVSEPTCLCPGVAGKGYGLARVSVRGTEAHSAFPNEGVSAILLAARFIARMHEELTACLPGAGADAERALFNPPHTTVNVGKIKGGSAKNIIAGQCEFLVEWRPMPREDPRAVFTMIERLAETLKVAEPRAGIDVELYRAEAGFLPAHEGPLQQALHRIIGRAPVGISFGSEASRIARIADEVIVMGPGDMHTAHSNRESVPAAELEEWTAALSHLLTSG
jgi:acetylornithine deacetylase